MQSLNCFKAYDIRGKLDVDLNEDIAYRIGRAIAAVIQPQQAAVGGDIRLSSPALKQALSQGLQDAGVNVIDLGMTGTEEIYFASQYLDVDVAIEITASHNPIDYNGMKIVTRGGVPVSRDSGLAEIQHLVEDNNFAPLTTEPGSLSRSSVLVPFVDHLMSYIEPSNIKPLKLVVNAGNGAAGHIIDEIEQRFAMQSVPIKFIKVHHEPNGHFPHGIPNPLLPDNRADTANAVLEHQADMGIAWDGDFDRCFLFDEKGQFIEGYYIVGFLAQAFLNKHVGASIIHDPRLCWNTQDIVQQSGGTAIMSKTGHAFIKERMRQEDAVYGGEMSAHHYFRDFGHCDSGMIPWLLVAELLSVKGITLSAALAERIHAYPSSGEINRTLASPAQVIESIKQHYLAQAITFDDTDGISLTFADWRFNLRSSNTEPVVRLNVESRGDIELMQQKTKEILAMME